MHAGQHPKIHPALPVITVGADDELTARRAYESGSDHHLAHNSGYLLLRAVLAAITRRTLDNVNSGHLHVGQIHVDLTARTVTVAGTPVHVSRLEFELLTNCTTATGRPAPITAGNDGKTTPAIERSPAVPNGVRHPWPAARQRPEKPVPQGVMVFKRGGRDDLRTLQ